MNIRDIKTYSLYGTAKLVLLVDEGPPPRGDMRYNNEGEFWFAERDGYVDYFIDSGGGAISRTITTVEGEERRFRNVEESRASIFNREGLGPFVDVKITTKKEEFEQGPGDMRKAVVTLDTAREAAEMIGRKMIPDWKFGGETTWIFY